MFSSSRCTADTAGMLGAGHVHPRRDDAARKVGRDESAMNFPADAGGEKKKGQAKKVPKLKAHTTAGACCGAWHALHCVLSYRTSSCGAFTTMQS